MKQEQLSDCQTQLVMVGGRGDSEVPQLVKGFQRDKTVSQGTLKHHSVGQGVPERQVHDS